MFIFLSKPLEGPDVSWLDKSSSHESAIVCVCLSGRSFMRSLVCVSLWLMSILAGFVVLHPYGKYLLPF